jgi:hypothetical protein
MKTVYEIYKALAEGKILLTDDKFLIKDINGIIHSKIPNGSGQYEPSPDWQVTNPYKYVEYIEPKWYELEDLPDGKLCRVRDSKTHPWSIDLITDYNTLDECFMSYDGNDWNYAEPLDLTKPLLPQLK